MSRRRHAALMLGVIKGVGRRQPVEASVARVAAEQLTAVEIEIPAVQLKATRGDRLLHERKRHEVADGNPDGGLLAGRGARVGAFGRVVNNTPRQINIFRALGATLPAFAHVPMILGDDGERLSKRHGAVSVMQYEEEGFLPPALLNYLARLGWSHGDEELFSMEKFVEWFDLSNISQIGRAHV